MPKCRTLHRTIILVTLIGCLSCSDRQPVQTGVVLKVDISETATSIHDIFSGIKIVPLETTEKSLFRFAQKIDINNDTIYLFDKSLNSLLMFGMDGSYLGGIRNVGRGEGEYLMTSDFAINREKNTILVLEPTGFIFEYDMRCKFISRKALPIPPYNYHDLEVLNNGDYITWSSVDEKDKFAVNVFESDSLKLKNSFFHHSGMWGTFSPDPIFSKYNGELYYHETLSGEVYHITSEGYDCAYTWDTGVRLIDQDRLSVPLAGINEALTKLVEDFTNGDIPFCFVKHYQCDQFYYSLLMFSDLSLGYLLYDKTSGESRMFKKTTEGIELNLRYISNEYALSVMDYDRAQSLRGVISKEDAETLDKTHNSDNPILVFMYYKK